MSVSEDLLQHIWQSQSLLSEGLKTMEGEVLQIVHPGRLNRLEGPDFKEAEIVVGGRRLVGDVEVHFYEQDWLAHGHEKDVRYDRVILHVVLFGDRNTARNVRTSSQVAPFRLSLLPHLLHDLEAYVNGDVFVERAADPLERAEAYMHGLEETERACKIQKWAEERWLRKVAHARKRIARHGWEEACHQYVLEVLGYRRNRGPMSALALRYPLAEMRAAVESGRDLFAEYDGHWRLRGSRPKNNPRLRLEQYSLLLKASPVWPLCFLSGAIDFCHREFDLRAGVAEVRKRSDLRTFRKWFEHELWGAKFRSEQLDTLVIDALLPLYSAMSGADLFALWYSWYPGNMPAAYRAFATRFLPSLRPCSNGVLQGVLCLVQSDRFEACVRGREEGIKCRGNKG